MLFCLDMTKKTVSKKSSIPVPPSFEQPVSFVKTSRRFSWRLILLGLAVLFIILAAANKGWVLAAIVEGKPIFSWQLNSTLRTRYGQQTLEGMIGEAIIEKEAKKSGVNVTKEDIEAKQKEILSSLGTEVNLADFLKFQGMSEQDFNQQLKVQLTVERLLTRDLVVSEQDIDNYLATSSATLTATDPASLREEAKNAIISNTVSEKLQSWFLELRQKSNVVKFL